jgi:cytochrome c peroxidase
MGLFVLSTTLAVSALLLSHRANSEQPSSSLSSERIALGQQLFNDPHLSADGSIRCASCHIPEKGYMDGRRVAVGVFGKEGTRDTPSLAALGASQDDTFFWDGRRRALDQAVLDPLTSPVEMGLPDQTDMLRRIASNPAYSAKFTHAFPNVSAHLTSQEVATALVDYVRSLKQPESAHDDDSDDFSFVIISFEGDDGTLNELKRFIGCVLRPMSEVWPVSGPSGRGEAAHRSAY